MLSLLSLSGLDLKGEISAVQEDCSSVGHSPQTGLSLLEGADSITSCFPLITELGDLPFMRKCMLGVKARAERLSQRAKLGAGEDAGGKPPGTGKG